MLNMERAIEWLSEARFAPFLSECDGDQDLAWRLYEWNAEVASTLFECFHHAEVLLRNAMMAELKTVHPLDYPWQADHQGVVNAARMRRDSETGIASADSVISELTLGFWASLLDSRKPNEELWRRHLHRVFPESPGTRKAVHRSVADMHELRNRCAHMESLLEYDPAVELRKLLSLVEWIEPAARRWIESIERVTETVKKRPKNPDRDVVVVGASAEVAVQMYERVAAYVCPSDRSFASVRYMGFYSNKRVEPHFPKIEDIIVPARWNREEADRLKKSTDETDVRLGKIMSYGLKHDWPAGQQWQVFLLSDKNSSETLKRAGNAPIVHTKTGRGSAFVQNKRYLARTALMGATTTDQLDAGKQG